MGLGPREEKYATPSNLSVAPTANASGAEAGEPTDPGCGPLLPLEKTAITPAVRNARTSSRNVISQPESLPHEFETTSGASAGSPAGASSHSKPAWIHESSACP